jgi:Rod binding domain-containing protein
MISASNTAVLMAQGTSGFAADPLSALTSKDKASKLSASQIDGVAKDFESMFIGIMLEQMFGDSLGSEMFGDKQTADVYKGLMMESYGKEITNAGGIGVAPYVKAELLKLQEQE